MTAWAALVVVYLVWGSTYLAIRVAVRHLPALGMAGVRYLVAGALLYPVAIRSGNAETRAADRPGRRQWAGCAVIGLLLLAVGNGGVSLSEQSVPSGLAAALVATVPLWTVVFAVPIDRQRLDLRAAAGLPLGLLGVAVLATGGSTRAHLSGVVVVLVAAAGWALGSVLGHRLRLPRRALLGAAMEMLVGGSLLIVAAAVRGDLGHVRWAGVPTTSWIALGYLVIAGSILGFTAYGYALAHLPLPVVSTYAYVNPVVAIALGVVVLHEGFSARDAVGAALVVGSVALTLHPRSAGRITVGTTTETGRTGRWRPRAPRRTAE